ncbi:purine-cytosine permease family protein [Hamadaea tsunoensis]|uniref:purine-cytosine permease family protein n=1 Tax=Hamadaea tsunoensis TaxID=53368 RepID=UPI00040FA9FF|nr:cytosine permease [Hamadaea tsunoensis]
MTVLAPAQEPGLRLADPQPRTLGFLDHVALWGNLGISLLGPVTAVYVVGAGMSILAAFTAIVAGTLIGTLGLALAAAAGARTGQPAMVMLRGLFGARLSWLPTALNLVQLLGWATFELYVIAAAAKQLLPWKLDWLYIVLAGVLTTVMAVRPLGSVRLLRRYALVAVVLAMGYLVVQLLTHPHPSLTAGGWDGFWPGADLVIAVSVSWIPLAADYSRHARTERGAFLGSLTGFSLTQIACYGLGLLALSTVAAGDPSQSGMFGAFIAVPAGWLAFGVLVVRELDESFANVYSTAISAQNLLSRVDRRILAVAVGSLATLLALAVDIASFQNFLYLVGSVFVPLFAVFVVRYFVYAGWRTWDTSATAPARTGLLLPWVLGFAAYQLVNPGQLVWWSTEWKHIRDLLHFAPQSWVSASLFSFLIAFVVALPFGPPSPRTGAPSPSPSPGAGAPESVR